jgi:TonB-linked SusC/RagA family outer membrane protein
MKRLTIFFTLFVFVSLQIFSQARVITGTVTSAEDGNPIPGVSIVVRGTTIGTITDVDGNYSLPIPENAIKLMFTFVGMKTVEEEIGDRSVISVTLEEDVLGLEEVVVTSLGITRAKKALGYSVQDVKGDELVTARESNVVNSLQGKLAGVQISNSSGNVSSGSRIIVRGMSTLTGNNMPLFVVDGVPIINAYSGSGESTVGSYSGTDYGNSTMDINASDIESISVLKGANAAALYGSRAVNGVVMITTKSGKLQPGARKGLGISFETNWMWSNPLKLPNFQNLYGQGYNGEFAYVDGNWSGNVDGIDESWGPPLDYIVKAEDLQPGGKLYWTVTEGIPQTVGKVLVLPQFDSPYDAVNDVRTPTPWVSHPDNVKDLFQTGLTATNTLTLIGGDEKASFRLSLSNQDVKGMLPNTDLKKNNVTFSAGLNVTSKFRVNASANYISNKSDNIMSAGYTSAGVFQSTCQWFGRQVDMLALKEYWEEIDPVTNQPYNWNHSYHDNPYWTLNKNTNSRDIDRLIGNVNFNYDFTTFLSLEGMVGNDVYSQKIKEVRAKGSHDWPEGRFSSYLTTRNQMIARTQLNFNRNFGDFSVIGLVGGEYNHYNYHQNNTFVSELIIPDLYAVSNAAVAATTGMSETHTELQSVFATANLGFRNYLFLDLTARNDWSSTLPVDNNSYFYPSASLGFVVTEALGLQSNILSYAKLRASYAEVGGSAGAYALKGTYSASDPFSGNPSLTYTNTLPPLGLLPQKKKSIEAGIDLKFLNNRIRLDATYYKENTTNQIMNIDISRMSGFNSQTINAGNIQNQGVELTFGLTPVQFSDFRWDMMVNWSMNKNKVIELTEGMDDLYLYNASWGTRVYARVGEPYGQLMANDIVRENAVIHYKDEAETIPDYVEYTGRPVVTTSGRYIQTPQRTLCGNVTPDWFGGVNNAVSYKDFNFSFLVDFRKGGVQYSVTDWFGNYAGVMEVTAATNANGKNVRDPVADGGGVLVDGVYGTVKSDGTPQFTDADGNNVATPVKNTDYVEGIVFYEWDYWGKPGLSVFDAGFVKLREVILGYTFHDISALQKAGISSINFSLVGRNLWLIHSNMPHVDPENAISAGNTSLGMNTTPIPSARTFGFNLKFTF